MSTEFDPYAVLGVAHDCSADDIKSAYRRLARENHPDVAPDKAEATTRMTQINAAWVLVGDPHKREGYDLLRRLEERERGAKSGSSRAQGTPAAKARTPRAASTPKTTPPRERASSAKTPPQPAKAKTTVRRPSPVSRHARLAEASRLLFKLNKPNESIEICRTILKTDFRNIAARELMGEAYLRLGQTERAIAVWEQALVLSPGNITLRRRWLGLMSPEVRAVHERKVPPPTASAPRATPVSSTVPPRARTAKAADKGLVGRLIARLGGKR